MIRRLVFISLVTLGIWFVIQKTPLLKRSKLFGNNEIRKESKAYYLPSKINEAKAYAKRHKMDTGLAMIIDYSIHSGCKRAYLIDLKNLMPYDSFLVSHGCGDHPWGMDYSRSKPKFSNMPESHCSSLGHFKIGNRGYSSWGINVKYLLHGLDSCNSNALSRNIVMHGWADIADKETFPTGSPEGWGCPAFSNNAMKQIDSTLKNRSKPVLLLAF